MLTDEYVWYVSATDECNFIYFLLFVFNTATCEEILRIHFKNSKHYQKNLLEDAIKKEAASFSLPALEKHASISFPLSYGKIVG